MLPIDTDHFIFQPLDEILECDYEVGVTSNYNDWINVDLSLKKPLCEAIELLNKIELKFKIKVKITLNFILANPDFDLIKASKYKQYYFKTFTEK